MDSNRKATSKFTCYFCNKTIENETQMGHTAVCSSVLVPCINKCGSYVPRRDLNKHNRECVNRSSKIFDAVPVVNQNDYYDSPSPVSTTSLDRHYNGYATTRPEPKLQEEILKLSKRLARTEQLIQLKQQNVPNHLLQHSQQHIDSIKNANLQYGLEIEKLKYQNKSVLDWKKNFESQLDALKRSLTVAQNSKSETDLLWRNIQERLLNLEKQQVDVSYLKDAFFKEQSYSRQCNMDFEQDLNSINSHFSQEHATFATVLNDQKKSINDLKAEISEIKQMYEDQKYKFTNIVFDLRATSQIASEAAEKIEIQERDFAEVKKDVNQMKLDLEILEGLASASDPNIKPGRLIWKITDVKSKLQKAKDFDSVLKSPIFYTHEYGYKIKVLMYMNGLKKFKDRYALLCIYVLKGEYDMLLKWPCSIEGNITLRNIDKKAKPFSKFITAKRNTGDEESEEPQESSSTYIFIPHSTLLKDCYVKEDTLFLDIKIQKNSKLETSL